MNAPVFDTTTHTKSVIAPVVLARITGARQINTISIWLIYTAIGCFLLFGTLKSLPTFRTSQLVYMLFHYLPYGLVGLTIPLSLYVAFVLLRYRLSQPSMLALCVLLGLGLFAVSTYVALAAWIGVAFLFRANLKRFFDFLNQPTNA